MKSLLEKLFKKEPQFSYTIADYQPVSRGRARTGVKATEYQLKLVTEKDEMDIDKIYQNS
jgi:hypothetical protein